MNIPNSHIRERNRTTNFKSNYTTSIFSNTRIEFRQKLISQGFPTQNKTLNADIPKVEFNKYHFWRGVIGGDGSLGLTGKGVPFVSLITKSEYLKNSYLQFFEGRIKR